MLEAVIIDAFAWLGVLMIVGVSALYMYVKMKDKE
jgi:hypothetical protein